MQKQWFKNYDELATSPNRKIAFDIANAGYNAIDTELVVANLVQLENNILTIADKSFDLNNFNKIKVIGFGKASTLAALALEKVLENRISEGAVIGLHKTPCNFIETFAGTHPKPTDVNILPGQKIFDIADKSDENDLIIVIVSGGGSALLCYPESECEQNSRLYDEFIKCGKTTIEMNTVRKHLSLLKGGGLAKVAYPATVIGLIFSDVPGDNFEDVASGPTYKDMSTIDDVKMIIKSDNLDDFDLIETTKDDKYFEKVFNFVLVSNKTAVEAMQKKSEELGLRAKIISTELYNETHLALKEIFDAQKDFAGEVILAAGEPDLKVTKKGGSGGRNLYMGALAVKMGVIDSNSIFMPLASDGMDNSDAAGAVVDRSTIDKIVESGIDLDEYLANFDAYPIFNNTSEMIITGPTGANVSDLMILFKK